MKACPPKFDLHAYVDGELSQELWQNVEDHLPRCHGCRDEVRAIARLNRVLHARRPLPAGADFEDRFREALLGRMVTRDEVSHLRQLFQSRRLAWMAAGVVMAVAAWAIMPGPHKGEDAEDNPAVAEQQSTAGGAEIPDGVMLVNRALAGIQEDPEALDGEAVRRLDGVLRRQGTALVQHLEQRLPDLRGKNRAAALRLLGLMDTGLSRAVLWRCLEEGAFEDEDQLLLVVRPLLRRPSLGREIRLVSRRISRDLSFARAFSLLAGLPGKAPWESVQRLCRMRLKEAPGEVIRTLIDSEDNRATALLLTFYLEGVQHSNLTAFLVRKPELWQELSGIAGDSSATLQKRRRALNLLGRLCDPRSITLLRNLVTSSSPLRDDALTALARMENEEAFRILRNQVPVGLRYGRTSGPAEALGRAMSRITPRGQAWYLSRAAGPQQDLLPQDVLILGWLTPEAALPRLYDLARNSRLRLHAVRAIVRLNQASSASFLRKMCRDRDGAVRRAAREGLKALDLPGPRAVRLPGRV